MITTLKPPVPKVVGKEKWADLLNLLDKLDLKVKDISRYCIIYKNGKVVNFETDTELKLLLDIMPFSVKSSVAAIICC